MSNAGNQLNIKEPLRLSNEESNKITRECLQTALVLLMSEKPFEKITITELVRRSGVSRTAFYRNYNTKEDILAEIATLLYETLKESLDNPVYTGNPREWFLALFKEFEKNSQLLRFLIETNQLALSGICNSVFHSLFPPVNAKTRYTSLAAEGALYYIIKEWLLSKEPESPEEMADICLSIFPDGQSQLTAACVP